MAQLIFNTGGGNDSLTVDLSGGNPFPSGGITFNGGIAGNDSLAIVGGNQGAVIYNYSNAHDGSVVMSNFGTVNYTGLEPITNSGMANGHNVFNLPAAATDAYLEDDGTSPNGLSRLRSNNGTFESTTFSNPTGSLTINRGNVADTLTITRDSRLHGQSDDRFLGRSFESNWLARHDQAPPRTRV